MPPSHSPRSCSHAPRSDRIRGCRRVAASLRPVHRPRQRRLGLRAVGGAGFNLNLFPNVSLSLAFFRVLTPVNVERTDIRHIALGMDGGPAAANRVRLRLHEHFQGPMGFGSPDDAEVWERVQRGTKGGEDLPILVNRGLADEQPGDLGPRGHISAETGMRAAYHMWKRMMSV